MIKSKCPESILSKVKVNLPFWGSLSFGTETRVLAQQNPTHTLMFDEGLEADTAAELADGLEKRICRSL